MLLTHTYLEPLITTSRNRETFRMESAVAKLRAALADPEKLILSPGVYDGFTGRIALGAGFDTLYMVRWHALSSRRGEFRNY